MKTKQALSLLLPALLALGGGCATKALWDSSTLDAWNEPADNANLHLFSAPQQKDVLAVYNEYSERKDSVHTRAYLLRENQSRVEERVRPNFANPNRISGLSPIPLFSSDTLPGTKGALYAVVSTNGHAFTLYTDGAASSHQLPVYNDGKGKAARIALTPVAVTADITIVGGFIGYLWLEGMAQSGTSYSWP